jgi:hypothetical protein
VPKVQVNKQHSRISNESRYSFTEDLLDQKCQAISISAPYTVWPPLALCPSLKLARAPACSSAACPGRDGSDEARIEGISLGLGESADAVAAMSPCDGERLSRGEH